MTETGKILGQYATSATTEATLYTVPSGKWATISSIHVCNRGGTATTFRVSVSQAGAATSNKDYLYYDVAIAANDSFNATIGVSASATDVVRVYAGNANLSFTAFGVEVA